MDRQRWSWVVLGTVVVAVAGWWFVLRSDAPPAPDLATAAETAAAAPVTTTATPTTAAPTTTATPTTAAPTTTAAPGPAGTWTVDPTIGSFNDYTSNYVGYRVNEVLGNGIGATTAVGRTPLVTGTVELSNDALVAAEIVADLRGLRSDKSFRDGKVQATLNTDEHPRATFTLEDPVALGDIHGDGASVEVTAAGTLTVNGLTAEMEVEVSAIRVGDVVTVVGSFPIVFIDHGLEAPSASIVVSVEDHGTVEFQLFLTR